MLRVCVREQVRVRALRYVCVSEQQQGRVKWQNARSHAGPGKKTWSWSSYRVSHSHVHVGLCLRATAYVR